MQEKEKAQYANSRLPTSQNITPYFLMSWYVFWCFLRSQKVLLYISFLVCVLIMF